MLKDMHLSTKLRKEIDKGYLDFIVGIFLSACRQESPSFSRDKKQWYLEEMLIHIKSVWPELSHDKCKSIIMSIVDMACAPDPTQFNRLEDYTKMME